MLAFLEGLKDAAPAVGAAVAIVSAIVALLVFWNTRRANRRRATLDMVMGTLLDDGHAEKYAKFKELIRKDEDPENDFELASLFPKSEESTEDRTVVFNQMNVYELTALGINRGIFDETFYKRWFHAQFTSDYESAKGFIDRAQTHKASLYCEMTYLYDRWMKAGHPVSNPSRFKFAWWGLTLQHDKIDQAREWSKAR